MSFFLFLNAHALWDEKEMLYYKNKYIKEAALQNTKKKREVFFVSDETKKIFTRKYGKDALKRLVYVNKIIRKVQNASLYRKLVAINKLVNKFSFMTDDKLWEKKNYWATPLEVIGTNHGDTEDIALLKFILMVKVGVNPNNLQLIEKNTFFVSKQKNYKENIGLFYFSKIGTTPFVIDYEFRKGKIYKYNNQFKFDYITKSQNKQWNFIFNKKLSKNDVDYLTNFIIRKENLRSKKEVNVFF